MALSHFDVRRRLVLDEANTIQAAYLRSQLLAEPHRSRLSELLVQYADNRIALGNANKELASALLMKNDQLVTDLWSATAAAYDSISDKDFSTALVEGMANVVERDLARKSSRTTHIPTTIFVILMIHILVAAALMGYLLIGTRALLSGVFLLTLLTLALLMIIDLDRPTMGFIRESQAPMERLRKSLSERPPQVFDRWRTAH